MNHDRKTRNTAEMEEQEQMDVASIFRCIFCSCDVDNTDLVPVSKLIEFVQPFMIEDLNALEELRSCLDPEGKNVLVNSERFYEVMGHWSQKLVSNSSPEESQFNRTPGLLEIDDKDLPYTHSTPRASLGEKLLRCKDLLNLSNVSGYSLSTSRLDKTNNADFDKTVLEEEIKRLEHLLLKTTNELTITKQQLAASEEQNETNQQDLERLNRRLHAEQQVNEHLQKEKNINEDLRDELSQYKKQIDELKRKLSHAEKDSMYHKEFVNELDEEKDKLIKKVEFLTRQHQDCLKEIFDYKTELETKDQQVNDIKKVYEELKFKYAEQKDFIDQLREQNEILSHQKSTLEKVIKAKSTTSIHSNLGNLNFNSPISSISPHRTPDTCSPPFSSPNSQPKCESKPLLRRALGRLSSTPTWPTNSLLDSSVPNNVNTVPVLSPVYLERGVDQNQESSEEDLYFQLQQGREKLLEEHEPNGTAESLHTEMHRAEPDGISETYPTIWFEKDEQLMILEEELEGAKKYLKQVEDEKNELLTKLKEQQKVNESLIETNFVLITKEESSQTKIKSLKKKLELLEGNSIIVENEHEVTLGEIEELKIKIDKMNTEIKFKNVEIQELKSKVNNIVSHETEIAELKKKLECSKKQKILEHEEEKQIIVNEYKEKLHLKDTEITELKSIQQQKDEEQDLTIKKLKEDLSHCLSKLSSKSRHLIDTQNRLKLLEEREILLGKENDSLKAEKLELENLKMEQDTPVSNNLENHSNIYLVSTEIQKHINSKNEVIEELKRLNLKMEYNLNEAQSDLKQKIDDILKLRNEWTNSIGIRNDLWQIIRTLQEENQDLLNSKEELKIEYNNLLICYDLEVIKNTKLEKERVQAIEEKNKFTKFISESEANFYELSQKKDTDKSIKTDNMSQTTTTECNAFEEEFSKIKLESDKLLEELETRLNEEVDKNRDLTNNLIEIKEHLDQSNSELLKMKEKVTENELKMLAKLQQNSESNKMLAEELSIAKENLQAKDVKIIDLEERLKEMEKTLQIVNEKRIKQKKNQMENESKNEELLKNINQMETLLNQRQIKIKESEDSINQLVNELTLTKAEKDKLNNELGVATLEHSRTKNDLENRLKEMENKLKILNEKYINQKKSQKETESKSKEVLKNLNHLETLLNQRELKIKESENVINQILTELNMTKGEKEKLNVELDDATLELSRTKNELENRIKEMKKKLNILNEKIIDQEKSQMGTESKNEELLKNINQLETLLNEGQTKIKELEISVNLLVNELNLIKAEKEKLNVELSDATLQLSKTKIEFKKIQDSLEHRLKEEENKNIDLNKHLIEIKNKLDEKVFELETLNTTIYKLTSDLINIEKINKKLNEELFETKKSLEQANYKLGQESELNKTQLVWLQNTNQKLLSELDMSKNEKDMLNRRLSEEIAKNTVLSQNYFVLKTERDQLMEVKEELNQKCSHIETITLELDATKRKLAKTVSCDSSTAKEPGKPKSYLKQQITIDKLKDKLDHLEHQLKCEKNKNQELKTQLSMAESRIEREKTFEQLEKEYIERKKEIAILKNRISIEKGLELSNIEAENKIKDLRKTRSLPSLPRTLRNGNSFDKTTKCEGKPVNKFTIASRPASPDSPSLDLDLNGLESARKLSFYTKGPYISCDTVLEIPSLDISGLPDDIIEELGLTEDSPRKKLNKEETEKSVTALTLRFVINNKDISERIEKQTEKYRNQYEELLTLIRDISHRLRDHVCIGTAEPIMPVFVILEDIKLQLKELVQTAGQVGVLIYEDRMKKCWNLVTNYMAMLRQENESLSNISRETTPTQTGLVRRRNRGIVEKIDLHVPTPRRRRRFIPCLRLTTILIVILALALTVSLVIHINCRMTASENQYCPLDGVVTRINMGVPPM